MIKRWNTIKVGKRLCAALLLIGLLFTAGIHLPAFAADAVETNNTYILTVSTGSSAGDEVIGFKLDYLTPSNALGSKRKASVFVPAKTALNDSMHEAARLLYSIWAETDDNKKYLNTDYGKGLRAYSADQYLLELPTRIDSLTGFTVVTRDTGSWYCSNISLALVNKITGIRGKAEDSAAQISYIEYEGTCIYKTAEDWKKNMTWSSAQNFNLLSDLEGCNTPIDLTTKKPIFRIDIADRYKAGLETAEYKGLPANQAAGKFSDETECVGLFEGAKKYATSKSISENTAEAMTGGAVAGDSLKMMVRYRTVYGGIQSYEINVLDEVVRWNKEQGFWKQPNTPNVEPDDLAQMLYGLAEQGESLVFGMDIPLYAELYDVTLIDKVSNDDMVIGRVAVYDSDTIIQGSVSDGFLRYSYDRTPLYSSEYQERALNSAQTTGITYSIASNSSIDALKPVTSNSWELLPDDDTLYVVRVQTDVQEAAATLNKLSMLIHYTKNDGSTSGLVELKFDEAAKDYHGFLTERNATSKDFWPKQTTDSFDKTYALGVSQGATINLLFHASDVLEFNSVDIMLDKSVSGTDDWQMRSLDIIKVGRLGPRKAVQRITPIVSQSNSYYAYMTRTLLGTVRTMASINSSIYVYADGSISVDFNQQNVETESHRTSLDIDAKRLSYSEVCEDYGYTESRAAYEVKVQVASSEVTAYGMGDCGSTNHFFFQLIFEEGVGSPIVLANQQIAGDAFRDGEEAIFKIYTNRDYGDVKKIRIIADDTASEGDDFDKLCIEDITVTRVSGTGMLSTWVFNLDNKWIDTSYHDDMEEVTGRTLEEVSEVFANPKTAYSVKLEFDIATGENDYNSALGGAPEQFEGDVQLEIHYWDANHVERSAPVDMVSSVYDYIGKTVKNDENATLTSDPTFMFRQGHVDRFMVTFEDIVQLKDIKITAKGKDTGMAWKINSISVFLVLKEGRVRLDEKGDYERTSTIALLTTDDEAQLPYYMSGINANSAISVTVPFKEGNNIQMQADKLTYTSTTPASYDDRVNMYIRMKEAGWINSEVYQGVSSTEQFPMQAIVDYKTTERSMASSLATVVPADGGKAAVVTNLRLSNYEEITRVTLIAGGVNCYVDYVDLERFRRMDGDRFEMLEARHFAMNGQDASVGVGATVDTSTPWTTGESQTISLGFTLNSVQTKLEKGKTDVAVRLLYESTMDNRGTVYSSRPVSLAEALGGSICPGDILTVSMNEGYVGKVVGVELDPTGNVNVAADTIRIEAMNGSSTAQTVGMVGTKSLLDGTKVWRITENQTDLYPVQLTFVTAASGVDMNAGLSDKARVTIQYRNGKGEIANYIIDDLNRYLKPGEDFGTGTTRTITVNMADCVGLIGMTVEPYDDTEHLATWKLDKVSVSTMKNGKFGTPDVRDVGETLVEKNPKYIQLGKAAIDVKLSAPDMDALELKNQNSKTVSYKVTTDKQVKIELGAEDARPLYTLKSVQRQINGGSADSLKENGTWNSGEHAAWNWNAAAGTITLTPYYDKTYKATDKVVYKINAALADVPSAEVTILIELDLANSTAPVQPAAPAIEARLFWNSGSAPETKTMNNGDTYTRMIHCNDTLVAELTGQNLADTIKVRVSRMVGSQSYTIPKEDGIWSFEGNIFRMDAPNTKSDTNYRIVFYTEQDQMECELDLLVDGSTYVEPTPTPAPTQTPVPTPTPTPEPMN